MTPKIHHQIHDHAMAGAAAVLDIVAPCLREQERREAFNLIFEVMKATLTSFDDKVWRMRRRIDPSNN